MRTNAAEPFVRVDAGGGSLGDVNWLLARDYQVHCKDYSGQQAKRLARSVHDWYIDQELPERQFGWVSETTEAYVLPSTRLPVRRRQQAGTWLYVLPFTPLLPTSTSLSNSPPPA